MEIYNEVNRKKLGVRIVSLILFIFILILITLKLHWFFTIWWFDMPVHFLGGFWVGLVFIWFLKPGDLSFSTVAKIILGFLLIGLSWEIFEILVDKAIAQNPFNVLDTLSDICFGLAGTLFSVLYFFKKIIKKQNIEV
jgi:hypothetical protein